MVHACLGRQFWSSRSRVPFSGDCVGREAGDLRIAPVLLSNVVQDVAGKGAHCTRLGSGGRAGTLTRSVSGIGNGTTGGRLVSGNVSTLRDVSGVGVRVVVGVSGGVRRFE